MQNFTISFTYPWLLLLLIPALLTTLIPYFRLNKRYRKTRNRITSITLHLIVMLLAISLLSGIEFHYQIPNDKNEIILLVDVSDTEETSAERRDEFIEDVLYQGSFDNYNMGVVTFGYDQVYAAPLTSNVSEVFKTYQNSLANLPDTSATNIAAALKYTATLFNNPESGKIVLITDGKETDEEALSAIRSIIASGIRIDTAYVPSQYEGQDVEVIGVELPDYHVNAGDECSITVTYKSSDKAEGVTLSLYDNGVENEEARQMLNFVRGEQTVTFKHTFASEGLHELRFTAVSPIDSLADNNEYRCYMNIERFDQILILESDYSSSAMISALLSENELYKVNTVKLNDLENLPQTVDGLREYDQVILNNVANSDLPDGFDVMLEEYVSVWGGGLFTVGGDDGAGNAHAYNREDLSGTLLQSMLPVQAIKYTPPVGVIVIIDRSGSMSADMGGETRFDVARAGARSCLNALTERDYFGIMTLDDQFETILEPTRRTDEEKILSAIDKLGDMGTGGGTTFHNAIDKAGQALRSLNVSRRHIIIVTDGAPGDKEEEYLPLVEKYYNSDGTTVSVVGIGVRSGSSAYTKMATLVAAAGGESVVSSRLHVSTDSADLIASMREDLNAPEIKEYNPELFYPVIKNRDSNLFDGVKNGTGSDQNKMPVPLGGFYGVKLRDEAEAYLTEMYGSPVYAQWKYGKGMVGSFMCDLSGNWSADFLADESGIRFIRNVVSNLLPTQNIRPNEISASIKEDNYTNDLSVYTTLKEGETIKGRVTLMTVSNGVLVEDVTVMLNPPAEEGVENGNYNLYVDSYLTSENGYKRCRFIAKNPGVYKIVLEKYAADGVTVLETYETYKSFAYSEEYEFFYTEEELEALENKLMALAESGNGTYIQEANNPDAQDLTDIFGGFLLAYDRDYNPTTLFIILILVLFLLDIAVRKFKFKWIHEIIRERKNNKNKK